MVLWKHSAISHFCLFVLFLFFKTRFLCGPDYPGTHSVDKVDLELSVDKVGLELGNLPVSDSQVLGSKVCSTLPSYLLLHSVATSYNAKLTVLPWEHLPPLPPNIESLCNSVLELTK